MTVIGCPQPGPREPAPPPPSADAGANGGSGGSAIGAPPVETSGPRHPEVLEQAEELATPRRELARLLARGLCEAALRPQPCWGDEGGAAYVPRPTLQRPTLPHLVAAQGRERGTWDIRLDASPEGGAWQLAVDLAPTTDAAWVERPGERWVFAGALPSTDVALVVTERTVTCFFLLRDPSAPDELTLRLAPNDGRLRLRTDRPVLDAKHEARAPRIEREGERVRLRFDRTGLRYPLLATIAFDLAVPEAARPLAAQAWRLALGAAPGARTGQAMAYDSLRQRVVLFGGRHLDDRVWESDGAAWRASQPIASPWHRLGLPGAFDAARGRVVLFGGEDFQGGHANDTWTWNGTDLLRALPATAPPGRYWGSLAYDARRERVVMFGGTGSEGHPDSCLYDCEGTWEWDGSDWQRFDPSPAPSPRFGAAMTYDPTRHTVLLFGGASYTGGCTLAGCNDTWEWDGATWTQRTPKSAPSPRSFAGLAWDDARGGAILFGGGTVRKDAGDWTPLGETWRWDGDTWTRLTLAREPGPRTQHGMVYDAARGRVVVYGGQDAEGALDDAWAWDGAAWSATRQPRADTDAAMAWDPAGGRVLLFGGQLYDAPRVRSDETWLWDGNRWELAALASDRRPPARRYPALATDRAHGVVVLFGGESEACASAPGATATCADTWLWDGSRWSAARPPVSPSRRQGHAMAFDEARGRVVLFGGADDTGHFARGTWEWDGTTWSERATAVDPANRMWHRMAYDARRGRVVLFGGSGVSMAGCEGECADTWEWDGTTWSKVVDLGHAPTRRGAAMAYDRALGAVLLVGGEGPDCRDGSCSDVWRWDGAAWARLDLAPGPAARTRHAMAWDDARREMVVYGGTEAERLPEETWVLAVPP